MNTKNNKRKKASQSRIEHAFVELLQEKEVDEITVTVLCKTARLNRSTFYANYLDIYDLIDKIAEKMLRDFHELYSDEEEGEYNSNDFVKLFRHIKEHQPFYQAYFKLGLDTRFQPVRYDKDLARKYYPDEHVAYHIEYFRAGITALIKIWLGNKCDISPQELFEILQEEYADKHTF